MTDTNSDAVRDLLVDHFSRVRSLVEGLTHGLTLELATWRADDEANSIAWLLWHLTRIQDDHIAGITGEDQAWAVWPGRFHPTFRRWTTGYGQSPDEAAQVRASGELLAGYHAD